MAAIGVSTSVTSVGPSGTPDINYSNAFFVVQSPWGIDNVVTPCTSFADYVRQFGGLNKVTTVAAGVGADTWTFETIQNVYASYYAVKGFFDEKGQNSPGIAYVVRVTKTTSGPTAASATFNDVIASNATTITSRWKGVPGGTTQITIKNPSPRKAVFATGAGTLSLTNASAAVTGSGTAFAATQVGNGIQILGVNYTIATYVSPTSITITPVYAGTTGAGIAYSVAPPSCYIKAYHPQSNITEEWDMVASTDAALISRKSQLIIVTNPANFTTAMFPAATAAAKLNAGVAATADPYTATAADMIGTTSAAGVKTGLQVFNDIKYGTGGVAVPNFFDATTRSGINTHCTNYYRWGCLGSPSALNQSTVITDIAGTAGNYLAYYWPNVWVTDQNSDTSGQLLIDPCGHVIGLQSKMDRDYQGPHKSAAGITHPFVSVLDVERTSSGNELVDDAGSNTLADSFINTIRLKGNPSAICGWGLRTLASDNRYRQIPQMRTILLVLWGMQLILERFVMEPIDSKGILFSKVQAEGNTFLSRLHANNTLFGTPPGKEIKSDNAFFVTCDYSNNPLVELGQARLHCDVAIVPTPNAEQIIFNLQATAPGFVGRVG